MRIIRKHILKKVYNKLTDILVYGETEMKKFFGYIYEDEYVFIVTTKRLLYGTGKCFKYSINELELSSILKIDFIPRYDIIKIVMVDDDKEDIYVEINNPDPNFAFDLF